MILHKPHSPLTKFLAMPLPIIVFETSFYNVLFDISSTSIILPSEIMRYKYIMMIH